MGRRDGILPARYAESLWASTRKHVEGPKQWLCRNERYSPKALYFFRLHRGLRAGRSFSSSHRNGAPEHNEVEEVQRSAPAKMVGAPQVAEDREDDVHREAAEGR